MVLENMTWKTIAFAITWILISLVTNSLPIQAQTGNDPPPPTPDRPSQREGGGDRRGNCSTLKTSENEKLIALVPNEHTVLTINEFPTFLFYVPYLTSNPLSANFVLKDNTEHYVMNPIPLTLSGTPRVIPLRLLKALEKEKRYKWQLEIICETTPQKRSVVIEGWIKRVDPTSTLASQLTAPLSKRERAELYIKEKFWLDALALLAEICPTDRQANADWTSALQSLKLGAIDPEKIIPSGLTQTGHI